METEAQDDRVRQNIDRVKAAMGDRLAQSAEEVIANHINAIGGEEALSSIKTLMYEGRNSGIGKADRPIIRYYKQPNLLRQQVPGSADFFSVGRRDSKNDRLFRSKRNDAAVDERPETRPY